MVESKQRNRKKTKKNISNGVAHIKASFNNTIINISDTNGETIVWTSGGSVGFKGSRKSTPFAATEAAKKAAEDAMIVTHFNTLVQLAAENDFIHYEISNFGKKGHPPASTSSDLPGRPDL